MFYSNYLKQSKQSSDASCVVPLVFSAENEDDSMPPQPIVTFLVALHRLLSGVSFKADLRTK